MIDGDWLALKDQVMAEMTDKAPLVAHGYCELRREFSERDEPVSVMDLSVMCAIWANMIVAGVEDRIEQTRNVEEGE